MNTEYTLCVCTEKDQQGLKWSLSGQEDLFRNLTKNAYVYLYYITHIRSMLATLTACVYHWECVVV